MHAIGYIDHKTLQQHAKAWTVTLNKTALTFAHMSMYDKSSCVYVFAVCVCLSVCVCVCVCACVCVCVKLPVGATGVSHNMAIPGPTGTEQCLLSFQEINRAREGAERRETEEEWQRQWEWQGQKTEWHT